MKYYILKSNLESVVVTEDEYKAEHIKQKQMYGGATVIMVDENIGGGLCLLPYKDVRQCQAQLIYPDYRFMPDYIAIKEVLGGISEIFLDSRKANL